MSLLPMKSTPLDRFPQNHSLLAYCFQLVPLLFCFLCFVADFDRETRVTFGSLFAPDRPPPAPFRHILVFFFQILTESNACLSADKESLRVLIGVRNEQLAELDDLAVKAAAEAAALRDALSQSEALRLEQARKAEVAMAELGRELAEASAAGREVRKRHDQETGEFVVGFPSSIAPACLKVALLARGCKAGTIYGAPGRGLIWYID